MAERLDCEHMGKHHSEDRILVYRGHVEPDRMCGYHASQV